MQLYLRDQQYRFSHHLDVFSRKPVARFDIRKLSEKTTSLELTQSLDTLNLHRFFAYHIFSAHIMASLTQWQHEGRAMRAGDTLVQQAYLPPFRALSVKLLFGVRIHEIIDQPDVKGFSYDTLEGHVETGRSIFTVERSGAGSLIKIHTFSAPGTFLSKLVGPVFSLPYQTYCTRAALKHVKTQLETT